MPEPHAGAPGGAGSSAGTSDPPSTTAAGAARGPRRRGRRRRDWLAAAVPFAAWLVAGVLLLLKLTLRRRFVGGAPLFARWARGEQTILAFWHEQLVMMPFAYGGRRVCIMVSRHRDGELITRAVRPLGIATVRGSSTRGWAGGLKGMLRAYRAGADLAFAPDGPRGPRRVVKSGVIQVARATGATIVPVAAAARWCRRLRSWDRLVVPLPASVVVYAAGTPLTVPAGADAAEVERVRMVLERELERLTVVAAEGANCNRGS